jgi:predicted nucleic acid-binding protein
VTEALETARSLAYEWVNVDIVAVLRLADETGLTTYDASYLHVASVLDLPLVTFDKRLARAASNRV